MRRVHVGLAETKTNVAAIDRYTAAHLGLGTLYGIIGQPWWVALGTAVVWEVIERPLKRHVPSVFPAESQDSLANSAADVAATMLGWGMVAVGRALYKSAYPSGQR
jgi:hypothetical protein